MHDWNAEHIIKDNNSNNYPGFEGRKLHFGIGPGMEFQYQINGVVKIGIGIQNLSGKGFYKYRMSNWLGIAAAETNREIKAKAIPVDCIIYLTESNYPDKLFAGVGLSYFFTSVKYKETIKGDGIMIMTERRETIAEFKKNALGFRAVIGTEYYWSNKMSFIAELNGRYAPISGYTGDMSYQKNEEDAVKSEALLYVSETKNDEDALSFRIIKKENVPQYSSASGSRDRDAIMDFSGFSLKLAAAYHF
jgi:hypothetical protein